MMSAKCIIMSNFFKKICMEGSSIDVPWFLSRLSYVYVTYILRVWYVITKGKIRSKMVLKTHL